MVGGVGPRTEFPLDWSRGISRQINDGVESITVSWGPVLDLVSDVVMRFLLRVETVFLWTPWPVVIVGAAIIAWVTVGWKFSIFAVLTLLTTGVFGLWESAMETMALIVVSVFLSIVVGIPIGVVAARSRTFDAVLRPLLDGMQTMPSFVYLVPVVMFFGIGNVPAVFATVIYAAPPTIRFTNLGIREVSPQVVEAARSFGTTPRQLLLKVQLPMALPTIMAGINQTTMMALAMMVIASLVGAGGLGEDVAASALARRSRDRRCLAVWGSSSWRSLSTALHKRGPRAVKRPYGCRALRRCALVDSGWRLAASLCQGVKHFSGRFPT